MLQEPGARNIESLPRTALPNYGALKPLDPSGSYILEAKIRVQDLNTTAVSEAAVRELNAFRERMAGCVELNAPERLSLDTRVKYQPKPMQRAVG
jgi:mediator of RNA polymerase II transcription subunit 18